MKKLLTKKELLKTPKNTKKMKKTKIIENTKKDLQDLEKGIDLEKLFTEISKLDKKNGKTETYLYMNNENKKQNIGFLINRHNFIIKSKEQLKTERTKGNRTGLFIIMTSNNNLRIYQKTQTNEIIKRTDLEQYL